MITNKMLEDLDPATMLKLKRKMRDLMNKPKYLPFFAKMVDLAIKEDILTSSNEIIITQDEIKLTELSLLRRKS